MPTLDPGIDHRTAARIRALRAERGLTLDALATLAGVSRAMLSRIERGGSSPTAQLLAKVCGGLGITMSALFTEAESPPCPVQRRAAQRTWRDPATGYVRRTVSPAGSGSAVDITEVEFPPGAQVEFENRRVAGADQHVWVLAGTLHLELAGEAVRLETGDCMVMRFGEPLLFRNPTAGVVRYAVIVSQGRA